MLYILPLLKRLSAARSISVQRLAGKIENLVKQGLLQIERHNLKLDNYIIPSNWKLKADTSSRFTVELAPVIPLLDYFCA